MDPGAKPTIRISLRATVLSAAGEPRLVSSQRGLPVSSGRFFDQADSHAVNTDFPSHNPACLERYRKDVFAAVGRRYRHILVDEWQDTNGPQYDLVLALVQAGLEAQLAREDTRHAAAIAIDETERGHRAGGIELNSDPPSPSIFVVGDTDQCIYRFRGANYTNVARFEEDFAGCRTVLLRENYRSTANIARAASAVIERVENRMKQPTKSVQVRRVSRPVWVLKIVQTLPCPPLR